MSGILREVYPIAILLAVVAIVVVRLPKPDLGHGAGFRRRRFVNWFPVGLTYAFLYMGRYNLNTIIGPVLDTKQFSAIYSAGTLTYGISFVLNGPLTDRLGGKKTIVAAALGPAWPRTTVQWPGSAYSAGGLRTSGPAPPAGRTTTNTPADTTTSSSTTRTATSMGPGYGGFTRPGRVGTAVRSSQ